MSRLEQRVAKVRCNSAGEWKLFVSGTDMCQLMYRYRHPEQDPFPGSELGQRLAKLGWMPDRRSLFQAATDDKTPVQRMMMSALAGWKPSETEKWVWTIPVYREVD